MKIFLLILSIILLLIAHPGDAQNTVSPVLSDPGGVPVEYLEDKAPVALVPNLQINDNDSEQMNMASFQLQDNYERDIDRLLFEETENIKAVFELNSGTLYLLAVSANSGVSIQEMQAAMQNVVYRTEDDDPGNREISVSITVTDLEANRSEAISAMVSVVPQNDVPSVTSTKTISREVTPGREYTVFEDVVIEDPDNDTFSRAVIEIVEGGSILSDRLRVDEEDTELVINNESGRVITVSGVASASEYINIIESVRYEHSSFLSREDGIKKISIRLTDADGGTSNSLSSLSRYFVLQPLFGANLNIPPSLKDLEDETDENNAYFFTADFFEEGFTDIDDNRLKSISIDLLPKHGKLLLDDVEVNNQFILNSVIPRNEINQLRYEPDPLYQGDDTFRWNASDRDNFAANSALVIIEVESVNQPPVLNVPVEVEVNEDSATPINEISTDDPDREDLSVELKASSGRLLIPAFLEERNLISFRGGSQNGDKSLVFQGSAALAAFALSGLVYSPEADFTGSDVIEVKVDDTDGGKAEGDIKISVINVNDAPELVNLGESPLNYVENEAPLVLTTTIRVNDIENDLISSATVRISEGYNNQDTLILETQNNVTSNFEEGTLSLSGDATAAVYQDIFRSIRFFSRSENPGTDLRIISFTATDSIGAESAVVSLSLEVEAVNDAPALAELEENQLGFVTNGNPVKITNELTVNDADDENLEQANVSFVGDVYDSETDLLEFSNTETITATWDQTEGILLLEGTATLTQYQQAIRNITYRYISDENAEEIRTISIRVSDGETESNRLERELIPNQPPLVSSFDKTTEEDQDFSFTVSDFPFQDTDNFPDGELFGIIITELPDKAVLTLNEDTLTSDDLNQIIPRDDIDQFFYRPLDNANGDDSFTWNASDGASFATNDVSVNIIINPLPDPPSVSDFSIETAEDITFNFTASQFTEAVTDPDGDALASVIFSTMPLSGQLFLNNIILPTNSQLNLDELSQLKYRPSQNYAGEDAFTWLASDGTNTSLVTATVNITINQVNDAPILNSFTRAIQEDEIYNFQENDFTQNFLDIEGNMLSQISIETLPSSGLLLLNSVPLDMGTVFSAEDINQLSYLPSDASDIGDVSFEWNASDGVLFAETTASVNIIIGQGVTDFSITALEDEKYSFNQTQFANNFGSPDGALQQIRIESLPENGNLLLNDEAIVLNQEINAADIAQLVYLSNNNYSGDDSFGWNANGGSGYTDQSGQVLISVDPVNDAPLISPIADQELLAGSASTPIPFEIVDLESDAQDLSITIFSSDDNIIPTDQIVLGGSGSTRNLIITPTEGSQGMLTLSVIVSDGEQQSSVQFNVDVAPYAISIATASELDICIGESGSLQLDVVGGQAPYQLQTVCAEGDCTADYSMGIITFEPETSQTYLINLVDENGIQSNVDTISVTVIDCDALDLDIPTAFTPNGDQINDIWQIENIRFSEDVLVSVFNRYGVRIFNSQGYDTPWDGTFENNPLPAGTYYYVIHIGDRAEIYNGSVSILR